MADNVAEVAESVGDTVGHKAAVLGEKAQLDGLRGFRCVKGVRGGLGGFKAGVKLNGVFRFVLFCCSFCFCWFWWSWWGFWWFYS